MTSRPSSSSASAGAPDGLWTRRRWIGTAALGLAAAGCSKFKLGSITPPKSTINILIWEDYLPDQVLEAFEEQTGIHVHVHTVSSNDEFPAKLAAKDGTYDLAMPAAFMARHLVERGLLTGFNQKNLTNLELLDRKTYNPQWDRRNTYTVPYIWGSTGIGYHSDRVDGLPKSWADLFHHQTMGHDDEIVISVFDDAHFTIGIALLYLNFSPATSNVSEIEQAGDLLLRLRSQIDFFESDHVRDLLAGTPVDEPLTAEQIATMEPDSLAHRRVDDERVRSLMMTIAGRPVDLAMAWSGDVTKSMRVNKKVRLSLPREGSIIFKDSFVIPQGAKNQTDAELFVNYLLRADVAGAITNHSFYANTIPSSKPYIDRFIVNGPSYFIHPSGRDFFLDGTENEETFQRIWAQIKGPTTPKVKAQV